MRRRAARPLLGVIVTAVAVLLPSTAGPAGAAAAGGGGVNGAPTLSVTDRLSDRRYVAAGDRAYDIGTEGGGYPSMGWHVDGEMGGIWAPPLKLLDGIWFGLDGTWLPAATRFTSGYGYVSMDVPGPGGVAVRRTDVVPDGRRAVLVGLTLTADSARQVSLAVDAHSELMSAYPWGSTTPAQSAFNLRDTASTAAGRLLFRETGTPAAANAPAHDWAAVVGSALKPAATATGSGFRGPQDALCVTRSEYCDSPTGKGAGGQLRYRIELAKGQPKTVWLTVAGSDQGPAAAEREWAAASADPAAELTAKIRTRLALAARSRVSLPGDPQLASAVEWGKQNLADLTQEARDLRVRAVEEGKRYPAPVGTIPRVRFEGAGFPDYPWLFATDGEYTSFALVAAGRAELVKDHLRALRSVSELVNTGSGKVAHEIVTTGDVYYGRNADRGDMDETAKFPDAVALVWRWTGDSRFRDEMYDFVKRNLRYLLTTSDPDHDRWPDGAGNVEGSGLGNEALDVSVYTLRGLYDLAEMADSRHDSATRGWALGHARSMLARFEGTWWMPEVGQYADSLTDPRTGPGNVKTQTRWWIGATPMEAELYDGSTRRAGIAEPAHAGPALTVRETGCYTGPSGLYVEGTPGCDGGPATPPGNRASYTVNSAVQAVGLGNYGRLTDAATYADANASLQLSPDEQPGAMPEVGPSPDFGRNIDLALDKRAMFMQAWGTYGTIWPVVHQQLGVRPDLGMRRLAVVPQIPPGQRSVGGTDITLGSGSMDVAASHDGSAYTTVVDTRLGGALSIGVTLPANTTVGAATLDGAPATYTVNDTHAGREVLVATTCGARHTLVVTMR